MRGEVEGSPPTPSEPFSCNSRWRVLFIPYLVTRTELPKLQEIVSLNFKITMLSICTCSWDYCWIRNRRSVGALSRGGPGLIYFFPGCGCQKERVKGSSAFKPFLSQFLAHPLVWAWHPEQRWPQAGPQDPFHQDPPPPTISQAPATTKVSVSAKQLEDRRRECAIIPANLSALLSNSRNAPTWIEAVLPTAYEFVIPLPVWTVFVRQLLFDCPSLSFQNISSNVTSQKDFL